LPAFGLFSMGFSLSPTQYFHLRSAPTHITILYLNTLSYASQVAFIGLTTAAPQLKINELPKAKNDSSLIICFRERLIKWKHLLICTALNFLKNCPMTHILSFN
jgi:hypothetical protein